MSLQVELLEQSFNYIKPYGNLFISSFYENLFKTHSQLESLYIDIDSETKQNRFWESLVLVMENLRQPDILKNILQGFGARLFTDGVLSEHYPLVRDAFLATFAKFLANEWTAEFEQAWKDAYVEFCELMLEGAEQARKQIISKKFTIKSDENNPLTANPQVNPSSISKSLNPAGKINSGSSDQTEQLENQDFKLNRIFFIGGSIAGVIAILLLIIFL